MEAIEWYSVEGHSGIFFKISENDKQLLLGGINGSQWCDKKDCTFIREEVQDATK